MRFDDVSWHALPSAALTPSIVWSGTASVDRVAVVNVGAVRAELLALTHLGFWNTLGGGLVLAGKIASGQVTFHGVGDIVSVLVVLVEHTSGLSGR